jgi:tetratricopeptide (TPR) repeat protein
MVEPESKTQEMLSKANTLKEEGNKYFKAGEYQEAIKRYAKISLYINGLVSKADMMAQYSRNLVSDAEKEQVDDLKHSTNSNMAAAFLELKNYQKVIQKASIALEVKEHLKTLSF